MAPARAGRPARRYRADARPAARTAPGRLDRPTGSPVARPLYRKSERPLTLLKHGRNLRHTFDIVEWASRLRYAVARPDELPVPREERGRRWTNRRLGRSWQQRCW